MHIVLDRVPAKTTLAASATIADALAWAQTQLPPGRVIVKIELDGEILQGAQLAAARTSPLAERTLTLSTHSQKDLALTMIGKLAALIDWLSPQHKEVASLLEKGDSTTALDRLGKILSNWHQFQEAYGNLAKLLGITLNQLTVREMTGEDIMNEFCHHLAEMKSALQNRDLVLLADILQYEMDGAVANWMSVLESTLAIVEPAAAAA